MKSSSKHEPSLSDKKATVLNLESSMDKKQSSSLKRNSSPLEKKTSKHESKSGLKYDSPMEKSSKHGSFPMDNHTSNLKQDSLTPNPSQRESSPLDKKVPSALKHESNSSNSTPKHVKFSSTLVSPVEIKIGSNRENISEETVYEFAMRCIFFHTHVEISMAAALDRLQFAFQVSAEKRKEIEDKVIQSWSHAHFVLQLKSQSQSLENHYYYNRKTFQIEKGFTIWYQNETSRLSDLITEILNNFASKPSLFLDSSFSVSIFSKAHLCFQILQEKLLALDIINPMKSEELHYGVNRKYPIMSELTSWILREFKQYYQIGNIFEELSLLQCLIKFDHNCTLQALQTIFLLVVNSTGWIEGNNPLLVTSEKTWVKQLTQNCLTFCKNKISRYYELYLKYSSTENIKLLLAIQKKATQLALFFLTEKDAKLISEEKMLQKEIDESPQIMFDHILEKLSQMNLPEYETLNKSEPETPPSRSQSTSASPLRTPSSASNFSSSPQSPKKKSTRLGSKSKKKGSNKQEQILQLLSQPISSKMYQELLAQKNTSSKLVHPVQWVQCCEEVKHYIEISSLHESVFKGLDIVLITSNNLVNLFENELLFFLKASISIIPPRALLDLSFKINFLNQFISTKVIKDAPSINLTIFSPIMTEFIDNIRSNFQKFLLPTIDRDNWLPIDEDKPFSSSVIDLFCFFGDIIEFVRKFLFLQKPETSFTKEICRIISDTVLFYVKHICETFADRLGETDKEKLKKLKKQIPVLELEDTFTPLKSKKKWKIGAKKEKSKRVSSPQTNIVSLSQEEKCKPIDPEVPFLHSSTKSKSASNFIHSMKLSKKKKNEKNISFAITPEMCTRTSNLEFIRIQLVDLEETYLLENEFVVLLNYLKRKENQLILLCAHWINIHVSKKLSKIINENSPSDKLFQFLNEQLEMMGMNASENVLNKFAKSLWDLVNQDLQGIICGEHSKLKTTHFGTIKNLYQELAEFFYADGKGISSRALEENNALQFLQQRLGTSLFTIQK